LSALLNYLLSNFVKKKKKKEEKTQNDHSQKRSMNTSGIVAFIVETNLLEREDLLRVKLTPKVLLTGHLYKN